MLFNEPVFLCAYLPLTLCLVALALRFCGRTVGLLALIASSLIFYGWWKASGLLIILGSIALNLPLALVLERVTSRVGRRALVGFGIIANLSLLGYYKYAGFLATNLQALGWAAPIIEVTLPIGLSFYTFQQIAFLVDTHTGRIGRATPLEYVVSVLFFPHLIAGPLVHYRRMIEQFRTTFSVNRATIVAGLPVFVMGLAKKVFIADHLAAVVNPMFLRAESGVLDAESAWMAAFGYATQLYFDFSGYSDMAIGLGLMFGIALPINFSSPYKSTSIIDFWRRWHITLSEFLRDYLYVPLGGNRKGNIRRYVNLMIVMLLGGLWHGAAWTFVFWGFLHGMFLVINQIWRKIASPKLSAAERFLTPCYFALTFICVVVAWVFFRSPNFMTAWNVLVGMTGVSRSEIVRPGYVDGLDLGVARALLPVALGIAWLTPNTAQIFRLSDSSEKVPARHTLGWKLPAFQGGLRIAGLAGLIWLSLFSLFGSTPSEFLYFQF